MSWWPRTLAGRLAVAATAALAVIVALQLAITRVEAKRAAARRHAAAAAAAAAPAVAASDWADQAGAADGVWATVRPVAGAILVATHLAALPDDAAPVVQVFADGGLALRRGAPRPQGPLATPAAGAAPAILLPGPDLASLTPAARGTLLDLLQRLCAERPIGPARLVTVDLPADPIAWQRLLSWVP